MHASAVISSRCGHGYFGVVTATADPPLVRSSLRSNQNVVLAFEALGS
jgi:hypothetical protein